MAEILLVDERGQPTGYMEKVAAHANGGSLHRSFSIFIFNTKGKLMLQKRASHKYHFGGVWSNTCCSHQERGETLEQAAQRKLKQEMGFAVPLKEIFQQIYKVDDPKTNLTEWEYDHVMVGSYNEDPKPNPEEVEDWAWVDVKELKKDMAKDPNKYSYWFKLFLDRAVATSFI